MTALAQRVRDVLPAVRRDLEDLVRIPSVWADTGRRAEVHRSADKVAALLRDAGFAEVEIVSEGGAPAASVDGLGRLRVLPHQLHGGLDGFFAARWVKAG